MKVQKANCGASVKAAQGGYMKVEKTGYSTGGMAQKKQEDAKRAKGEKVEASKGGYAKKKKVVKAYGGGMPMRTCSSCPSPKKCTSNGRCAKTGKKLG